MKKYVRWVILIVFFWILLGCTNSTPQIPQNHPPELTILTPTNGTTDVPLDFVLKWECTDPDGDDLVYDIYLGTSNPPPLLLNDYSYENYAVTHLQSLTTYYWKIVAKDSKGGVTEGPIWSFTTLNNPPFHPAPYFPLNGAIDIDTDVTLSWSCMDIDGDSLTYDVYFGKEATPPLVATDLTVKNYDVKNLEPKTVYYWKIVAKDGKGGVAEGGPWYFTTCLLKWSFLTNGSIHSSPAVGSDGTIYIGSYDNYLYAINPDGTLKWKFQTGDDINSSPVIGSDGTIYIGSNDDYLYAINPDGTLKWKYLTGGNINSLAIGIDGTIYIGNFDKNLYAINPDGTLKWKYLTLGNLFSSPAITSDGTIYIGSNDNNLYAINPNGTLKWKYLTGGDLFSSPAIGSDGTIYIGSKDNYLYAINPDGTHKWRFLTGGGIFSSPVLDSNGNVYIGSADNYLYAINSSGIMKWRYQTGGSVYTTPLIGSDGTIYFGSYDKYFYALNPDGTLKWKYLTNENVNGWLYYSSPAISNDGTVIYIGAYNGILYALYDETGGLNNSSWPKIYHDNLNTGNINY